MTPTLSANEGGRADRQFKRHLAATHDLEPADYSDLFDLKRDYPMVASDYVPPHSAMAKKTGLGGKPPTQKGRKKAASSRW